MAGGPSLTWVGYNLLRLTAIVIICWALAVQFIAIGNDMSAYSDTQSTSTSNISSGVRFSSTSTASSRNPYAAPTARSSSTNIAAIGATTQTPPAKRSLEDITTTYLIKRQNGDSDGEVEEANYGRSSVPRQPGGVVFTIFSRLIMASTLSLLLLGQFGWPEMFLYDHVPWLGPQSTPIWLGLIQTIVAIENLRVYAKSSVLPPCWALFVIGLINLTIGGVLLWLGRNLPKSPSPPLYFNLSTRVMYFRPPPQCYDPITKPYKQTNRISDPELQDSALEKKQLPSSNLKSLGLVSDDEHELEKISIHSEEGFSLPIESQFKRQTPIDSSHTETRNGKDQKQYTDVTKGGYPTFSGGGLTDPSSQVPLGFIERTKDGRKIEFINSEIGQDQQSAQQQKRRSDLPPRSQSRKKAMALDNSPQPHDKLVNLGASTSRPRADSVDTQTLISKGRDKEREEDLGSGENGLEEAAKHARMRRSTLSSMTFGPLPSTLPFDKPESMPLPMPDAIPQNNQDKASRMEVDLKRSNSKSSTKGHGMGNGEKRRQSTSSYLSATLEMGPRFPFPPSRQTSLRKSYKPQSDEKEEDSVRQIVESPKEVGLTSETKGPRPPFRAGSKREKRTVNSADTPLDEDKDQTPVERRIRREEKDKKRQSKSKLPLSPPTSPPSIPLPNIPKSPKTPRSSHPSVLRRRSSSSFTATSPKLSSGRKRAATLATPAPVGSLRPSLSVKRASSTRRGSRTARGVRFNLSPHAEADDQIQSEWSSSSDEDSGNEEIGEIRELVINDDDCGFVGTPTQKLHRPESISLDDVDLKGKKGISSNNSGRTRNQTVSKQQNKKDSEYDDLKRNKSQSKPMILGGDYLNGGRENYL
ncbi:hypothetical protein L486_05419 [Kwoniella mangroviensis CBS 10435]|uniref:Uncharacterized protein n=1 Tax=Kwoniella mangroviensis CBS 10435 TaxID=1331196 RepID=A0A1B9ILS8_9TREE|nr:hypothetical protein L486_05419 [Kwoniella mangroviensis CBS 10435]